MVDSTRGQALTLEAVTAAILLLVAVGFALQVTAVTPLSASTSSQHLENQLQSSTEGVLASAAQRGALKTAILDWNETAETFNGTETTDSAYFRRGEPTNRFGDTLNRTFGERTIAYNVIVHYQNSTGARKRQRLVYKGEPSDHAVSASRAIVLFDSDNLTANQDIRLDSTTTFYAPDAAPSDQLYNLVRVEVIAWRI